MLKWLLIYLLSEINGKGFYMMEKGARFSLFLFLFFILVFSQVSGSTAEQSIEKHVLSNGLTLILKEEPSRELISLCAFVDGGSRIESPDVSGISHFIEHLVFRGPTSKIKELELRKMFRIWGEFEGFTSNDVTCYGFTCRPDDFDESLDAYVDGLMNLTIPESVIEKERTVVCQEIHQRGDMPYVKIYDLFSATAFKAHSYRNPVIGYEELIRNMPSDMIRGYYHEHYMPDHFVIAVVGQFENEDMMMRIDKAFSEYKSSGKNFEQGVTEPTQTSERSVVENADINTMHMLMGYRIPPAKEMTSPSIEILAQILGGGEDSRLYRRLKLDSQIVDEIYCFPSLMHDEGFFYFYAMAKAENRDAIREAILDEIRKIGTEPPSDDEISRAKRRIENDFHFGHQTFWEQALELVSWEVYGNLELGINWVKAINETKADEIVKVAQDYLHPECLTWVALIPREQEKPKVAGDAPFMKEAPSIALDEKSFGSLELPNGLKVVFKRDTSSSIVGISVLGGYGQVMEESGEKGIGNLCARMLLKGCADMDSTAFRKKSEKIGARITSDADRDFIKVSMEITKDKIDEGLELLSQMIFKPAFDEDELELVRQEILAEIVRKKDSSFPFVNDKFFSKIYGDTPYGCPIEGYAETVELINREMLKKYYSLAFAPKNLIIAVTGNLESEPLLNALMKYFGNIQGSSQAVEISEFAYPFDKVPLMKADDDILNLPRTQVSFNMGLAGPSAQDPDYPALRMLVRLLGLRVFDQYVYELGWAYRMWFFMPTTKGPSPIMFEMGVQKDLFDDARDGLKESMREVTQNPISQDEYEKTLDYILQSFHLGMQKNVDTAFYIAFYEKLGLGYKYVEDYDEIYKAVTIADLSRVARKYFHADEMKLVAIVPD